MRLLLSTLLLGLGFCAIAQPTKDYEMTDPVKLPQTINSDAEEGLPIVAPDGKTLYFVRTFYSGNTGGERGGQDIWYSTKKDGKWTTASNEITGFNNEENNAVTGISHDGNILYLHGTYLPKEDLKTGLSYATRVEENVWSEPRYLHVPRLAINSDHYSFFLDPHGEYMVISAKGRKSIGEEDLYLCVRGDKGRWEAPIHLGPVINTKGYEIAPFLGENGRTLYFSSNGHAGEGDADIFVSHRLDDSWTNWSEPRNLGPKVNSAGFDAYFSVNEDGTVFFASSRDGGYCDIYEAQFIDYGKEEDTSPLETLDVLPSSDQEMVEGYFEYNELPAANSVLELVDENGLVVGEIMTDENGKFNYNKLALDNNYLLRLKESDGKAMDDTKIFLLDENGEKKVIAQEVGAEGFRFKTLSPDEYANLKRAISEDADILFTDASGEKVAVSGIFEYDQLPGSGVKMNLMNEDEVVIRVTETDETGAFNFKDLPAHKDYYVAIDEEDGKMIPPDAKLYLMDDTGNKVLLADKTPDGRYKFKAYSAKELETLPKLTEEEAEPMMATIPDPVPTAPTPVEPVAEPTPAPTPTPVPKPTPNPATTATPEGRLPFLEKEVLFNYDFNVWRLSEADQKELDEVIIPRMKQNERLVLYVDGHADAEGSNQINNRMANNRALDVRQYLMSRLIEGSRIITKGYGEDRPIASNDDPDGRAKNRRVELRLKLR